MSKRMLQTIDAVSVSGLLDAGKAILVDIREADEHASEHIIGAHLMPLSAFDPSNFPHARDKVAVFHCLTGRRTDSAAQRILSVGLGQAYQLEGGLQAWQAAGFPVNVDRSEPV